MKLGIVFHRDVGDGVKTLRYFKPYLEDFFGKRNIDFRIYIGHQVDDKNLTKWNKNFSCLKRWV